MGSSSYSGEVVRAKDSTLAELSVIEGIKVNAAHRSDGEHGQEGAVCVCGRQPVVSLSPTVPGRLQ